MASQVQICNIALTRLGAARITSLTDNTNEAKLCNILYDDVVEEVILEGPWSSAINRASLAQTANTPTFGYSYEFQLPTNPNCLKVLSINEDVPGSYEYRIEKDKLLADVSSMKIKYIGMISDPQSYDPMLKRAIISRLTAELAYSLTGQANIAQLWYQKYEQDVDNGLAVDGQQGTSDRINSPDLTEVR